jgi:triphosphoribosyl-dephospho-CoA synthase
LACAYEAIAPKPGNVYPGHDFPNLTFFTLIASAKAIAPVMGRAPRQTVGDTILDAIKATRRVAQTNTNLGIVLLLAPLAKVADENDLQMGVPRVLAELSVSDANLAYEAIRLAHPGGLGTAADQDVRQVPTVTLRDAMQLAAERDLIAAQYVNGFADVFAGCKWLQDHIDASLRSEFQNSKQYPAKKLVDLIVELYLWLLARNPDSLVARKRGMAEAMELQRRAIALITVDDEQRLSHLAELSDWFAAAFPHRNPGTTADLVCASLFVALRTGIIPLPDVPEADLQMS